MNPPQGSQLPCGACSPARLQPCPQPRPACPACSATSSPTASASRKCPSASCSDPLARASTLCASGHRGEIWRGRRGAGCTGRAAVGVGEGAALLLVLHCHAFASTAFERRTERQAFSSLLTFPPGLPHPGTSSTAPHLRRRVCRFPRLPHLSPPTCSAFCAGSRALSGWWGSQPPASTAACAARSICGAHTELERLLGAAPGGRACRRPCHSHRLSTSIGQREGGRMCALRLPGGPSRLLG